MRETTVIRLQLDKLHRMLAEKTLENYWRGTVITLFLIGTRSVT
jgi:hypothetical protein